MGNEVNALVPVPREHLRLKLQSVVVVEPPVPCPTGLPTYGSVTSKVLKRDQARTVHLPDTLRESRPSSTLTVSLDRVDRSIRRPKDRGSVVHHLRPAGY